jgi:hypothetical protein
VVEQENLFLMVAEAANHYCHLIEQTEHFDIAVWIENLRQILLKLESILALCDWDNTRSRFAYPSISDLDGRFELYLRLKSYLEGRDEFWSEEDLAANDDFMSGSLSENLTDIYCELKRGLAFCAAGLEGEQLARQVWFDGYHFYWHRQLSEALSHLKDRG